MKYPVVFEHGCALFEKKDASCRCEPCEIERCRVLSEITLSAVAVPLTECMDTTDRVTVISSANDEGPQWRHPGTSMQYALYVHFSCFVSDFQSPGFTVDALTQDKEELRLTRIHWTSDAISSKLLHRGRKREERKRGRSMERVVCSCPCFALIAVEWIFLVSHADNRVSPIHSIAVRLAHRSHCMQI